jgi:hypothetical protein
MRKALSAHHLACILRGVPSLADVALARALAAASAAGKLLPKVENCYTKKVLIYCIVVSYSSTISN